MRPLLFSLFTLTFFLGCSLHQGLIGEPPVRESPAPIVMGRSLVLGNAPCLPSPATASEDERALFAASVQVESVHLFEAPSSLHDAGQPREAMCH
jgi:hypothetical protein